MIDAQIFDALVVRRRSSDDFSLLSPLPCWFPIKQSSGQSVSSPLDLLHLSFFLRSFLGEADSFWQSGKPGHCRSGLWSEPNLFGEDVFLEATAVVQETDQLLVVQRYTSEMTPLQSLLQKAREAHLRHDRQNRQWQDVTTALSNQLQESEHICEDLSILLDQLGVGSILIDDQARVIYVNHRAKKLLTSTVSNFDGKLVTQILPMSVDQEQELKKQCQRSRGQGVPLFVKVPASQGPQRVLEITVRETSRNGSGKILVLREILQQEGTLEPIEPPSTFPRTHRCE